MNTGRFIGKLLFLSIGAFFAIVFLANPSTAINGVASLVRGMGDFFGLPAGQTQDERTSDSSNAVDAAAEDDTPEQSAPEPTDAPDEVQSNGSGVDAGTVALIGLGGLGSVLVLAGAAAGTRTVVRRRRGAAADRKILLGRWDAAKKRHVELRKKSYPIETGLLARVDYPALFDYADPATEAWVEAAEQAAALELDDPPLHSEARIGAYEAAVGKADWAWNRAFANARRVNLSRFTPEERSRVEKARKLLTRVLDAASTEHERRAAYEKAVELLGGLIEVPEKVLVALEERIHVRLALTAGQRDTGTGDL